MGKEKGMHGSLICWIILNHSTSKDTRQSKVQFKPGWNRAGGILWDLLRLWKDELKGNWNSKISNLDLKSHPGCSDMAAEKSTAWISHADSNKKNLLQTLPEEVQHQSDIQQKDKLIAHLKISKCAVG